MSNTATNYFAQLAAIDVSKHVEKKGEFSYLSWPFAVQQLRMFDETATWEVKRFNGLPFLTTDFGTFVEVAVTVKGVTLSQIHPVLDQDNHVLLAPSAFDINTSIQRCLVKAIAIQGLGISIYSGEDLPHVDGQGERPKPAAMVKPSQPQRQNNVVLLTSKQLAFIKRLVKDTGTDEVQLLAFFGYDTLEQIPKSEVNRVIRVLENNQAKAA